jgi:hypothetical protein
LFNLFPTLKSRKFWGSGLWSRGTYYATVGHITEDSVRKYIETQKERGEWRALIHQHEAGDVLARLHKMFGLFHGAGYKGLYGSLGVDAIKARKGINPKEQLMDRMNTTELSANQFRMTHTREKLKQENIKNPRDAMEVHEAVGKEVRAAIVKIGVALPENIPAAEHIKNIKKRLKTSQPYLTLEPKDAIGLISPDSTESY